MGKNKEGDVLIILDFDHNGIPVDISNGRKLAVEIMEMFLNNINQNHFEYLSDKPKKFTVKNFTLGVYFHDKYGHRIADPYLNTISICNEKISFFTRDLEDFYKYKSEIYEPYDEALTIVKGEKPDRNSKD